MCSVIAWAAAKVPTRPQVSGERARGAGLDTAHRSQMKQLVTMGGAALGAIPGLPALASLSRSRPRGVSGSDPTEPGG